VLSRQELESLAALMNRGDYGQLEDRARGLLTQSPQAGVLWQLLAVALSKQDKDALPAWLAAVQWLPEDASAHLNLGNALGRAGRLAEAEACYTRALTLQPGFAEAHHNLGELRLELNQLANAIVSFRRAIEIRPEWAQAQRNLGKALLRGGRYLEALGCCHRAVQLAPDSPEAHNSLGNALCRLGRPSEALVNFRRALTIQPQFAQAHANLGNALRSMGRVQEALAEYRLALRIQPNFVAAHIELATALRIQRRTAEAEIACREALRLEPESAAARIVLAELRADVGAFSEAASLLQEAVAKDPQSAQGWAALARMRRMTPADEPWLSSVQSLLARGVPPQREITLHYALGKYFDDTQQYSQAFAHFQHANELSKHSVPAHDRLGLQRTFERIIEAHTSAWVRRSAAAAGDLEPQPVFIVGMLRSGTTLVEQILSSHPNVSGAGELTFWSHTLAPLLESVQQLRMDAASLSRARDEYLALLEQHADAADWVVDKLPTNFLALGLIHAAFPHARIISMARNPLDTCLSIYFQHFETANTYTHDLHDLAHYYREYRRLMNHWRAVLPVGAILELPYEGLVAEPEKWTRALLDFIGVPWDPRCLEFHRAAQTVVTASKWQVRQPIGSASVERWRHYEQFIGPLKDLL